MSKEIKNMAYYKAKHAASEQNSPLKVWGAILGAVASQGMSKLMGAGKEKDAKRLEAGKTKAESITDMPRVGV